MLNSSGSLGPLNGVGYTMVSLLTPVVPSTYEYRLDLATCSELALIEITDRLSCNLFNTVRRLAGCAERRVQMTTRWRDELGFTRSSLWICYSYKNLLLTGATAQGPGLLNHTPSYPLDPELGVANLLHLPPDDPSQHPPATSFSVFHVCPPVSDVTPS